MGRYTAKIVARRAQEAEKQALIDAGLAEPDPVSTENMFDVLDRELAIAKYIAKEHGTLEQFEEDLAAEFAGKKLMTVDEMMEYLLE